MMCIIHMSRVSCWAFCSKLHRAAYILACAVHLDAPSPPDHPYAVPYDAICCSVCFVLRRLCFCVY